MKKISLLMSLLSLLSSASLYTMNPPETLLDLPFEAPSEITQAHIQNKTKVPFNIIWTAPNGNRLQVPLNLNEEVLIPIKLKGLNALVMENRDEQTSYQLSEESNVHYLTENYYTLLQKNDLNQRYGQRRITIQIQPLISKYFSFDPFKISINYYIKTLDPALFAQSSK